MVNYGYGPDTRNWNESKKNELALLLEKLVSDMTKEGKIKVKYEDLAPYVEIDQMYRGVRIRKITHLTEEVADELIHRSDQIYTDLMTPDSIKELK